MQNNLASYKETEEKSFKNIIENIDLKMFLPKNYLYFHFNKRKFKELGWGIDELDYLLENVNNPLKNINDYYKYKNAFHEFKFKKKINLNYFE